MANVPLGRGAYDRTYGQMPRIRLENRFFEEDPTNQVDGVSLLSRPATTLLLTVGEGRVRAIYTKKGEFDNALFAVVGTTLYRINTDLTINPITGTISGDGFPKMAARDDGKLFICDGTNLQYYEGDEVAATGSLTLGSNPTAGQTVTINGDVYTFVSALDSSGGDTYDVVIGGTASVTIDNLIAAINNGSGEGVVYGQDTPISAYVTAAVASGDVMDVTSKLGGVPGDAYTTTSTLDSSSGWGGATLSGGVNGTLNTIAVPDSLGVVAIDILSQHVICVIANSQRFYWVMPGEVTIDSLDFASAEQQPDELISVRVVGDRAYLLGEKSIEVWYANPAPADSTQDIVRQQGLAFSRGIVEGTDVAIDDAFIFVGDNNIVYEVTDSPRPISTPYISEKIRKTRELERLGQ